MMAEQLKNRIQSRFLETSERDFGPARVVTGFVTRVGKSPSESVENLIFC